jgi:hypothetical protein
MADIDDEDHARGARVEVAIHYAQKGDLAQAYGIAAGLPLAEREALIQIIAAVARSNDDSGQEAQREGPGRPGDRGRRIIVAPGETGSAVTPAQGQLPERVEPNPPERHREHLPDPPTAAAPESFPESVESVLAPRPGAGLPAPAPWGNPRSHRGPAGRIGAMAVWGLFKGAAPVVIDEQTGLTDQEQRVRAEYGHRATVSLMLGAVVMLGYLLWRATGPLRGRPIGSAVSILGTEASIAVLVVCAWAGLRLVRHWAVNQYWDRTRTSYRHREPSDGPTGGRQPDRYGE